MRNPHRLSGSLLLLCLMLLWITAPALNAQVASKQGTPAVTAVTAKVIYCFSWWSLYWFVAVVLTGYQTWRGYQLQKSFPSDAVKDKSESWPYSRKIFLLYLADAILYFGCSAAGFISLRLAVKLAAQVADLSALPAGNAVLLASLALFGLFGVTGQLPYLIQRGWLTPKVKD